ncbi:MAG TPA: type IV pilus modification protein PilV, partial [Halieaceae bacterium]|nr:type IV pilus modification protein PilV [Halieaceae bacterium]
MMFLARKQHSVSRTRRQAGVTLIEALVTFVILSVGLLGIVSLQAVSKSAQHQGIQRSKAVMLANDLVERIRINPAGLATYTAG